MITKRSISKPNSIEEFGEIAISKKKPKFPLLASTIQFSNHHAPHVSNPPRREQAYSMWASNRTTIEHRGVAVREPKSIPIPLPDGTNPIQAIDLFHTSIHTIRHDCHAIVWHTLSKKHWTEFSVERR